MTANELADGILAIEERIFLTKKEHQLFQNSATMLRQQQAEIEQLKSIVEDTIGQAFYEDDYHKAQSEIESLKKELALQKLSDIGQAIERELTDEEILEACSQIEPFDDSTIEQAFIEFARAILKKASEK